MVAVIRELDKLMIPLWDGIMSRMSLVNIKTFIFTSFLFASWAWQLALVRTFPMGPLQAYSVPSCGFHHMLSCTLHPHQTDFLVLDVGFHDHLHIHLAVQNFIHFPSCRYLRCDLLRN